MLAFLNVEPGPKPGMRAEDIAVRHIERGAIPVLRLPSGQFAVRPLGDAEAILTSILDEVDRFIVRPDGKVLRPHEMSRTSWQAVNAAGRLAVFTNEAVDPDGIERQASGNLDLFAVTEPFDAYQLSGESSTGALDMASTVRNTRRGLASTVATKSTLPTPCSAANRCAIAS